jgi:plastocyanin
MHAGLYHYYNALTTRPLTVVANNEVLANRVKSRLPSEGWIVVLPTAPGLEAHLNVPIGEGVFAPKALVTVVGATVVVANHDSIDHNFVIDPASPSGAAFVVGGTDPSTPSGWQRALVIQEPGLYHVYCTLHTRVIGVVDGWHIVVPNEFASGFPNGNAMEAWIIALPATTT